MRRPNEKEEKQKHQKKKIAMLFRIASHDLPSNAITGLSDKLRTLAAFGHHQQAQEQCWESSSVREVMDGACISTCRDRGWQQQE